VCSFQRWRLFGAPANVGVYATRLADGDSQDWPLLARDVVVFGAFSASPLNRWVSTRYRSVLIKDDDYRHGFYALAVVATSAVTVRLTTADPGADKGRRRARA